MPKITRIRFRKKCRESFQKAVDITLPLLVCSIGVIDRVKYSLIFKFNYFKSFVFVKLNCSRAREQVVAAGGDAGTVQSHEVFLRAKPFGHETSASGQEGSAPRPASYNSPRAFVAVIS